jgi:hypothetical protein
MTEELIKLLVWVVAWVLLEGLKLFVLVGGAILIWRAL